MSDKPSIVLVSVDTLRADCVPFADPSPHLRDLGHKRPDLPAFTELVQGAHRFTQAISCASYTPPAHASMLTGLLPTEHGIRTFSMTSLSRGVRTLAEILRDAGYGTCAMCDQPAFFQPQGLLRGFQLFVPTEDEALAWWDSYEGMPRFLFIHLWDVHKPYGMPVGGRFRGSYSAIVREWTERLTKAKIPLPTTNMVAEDGQRHLVTLMQHAWEQKMGLKAGLQPYLDGLAVFDRGRLASLVGALKSRRVTSECLTIVTADHGEGRQPPTLRVGHGNCLIDDQIRIPLFIRVPGKETPQRITTQVSQADITPTILDLVGLLGERTQPRAALGGRSLAPLLRGGTLPDRPVYAENWTVSTARRVADPEEMEAEGNGRPVPVLRMRMVRYPDRKYVLRGERLTISDEALLSSPEEFLYTVYHGIFGESLEAAERERWLPALQQATDLPGRRALLRDIIASVPPHLTVKYQFYDLGRDPLELQPRDPQADPVLWADYEQQMNFIMDAERWTRPGEPKLQSESDQRVVLDRLQALGYVE